MKEPKREEDAVAEQRTVEQEVGPPQELATDPKAYAFDGWAMVPLEFDPV
ncbi:hypothetical protein [Sphingomonas sp. Root241]|nr:hypothetical protein [Sphingomonas sp. Root241]